MFIININKNEEKYFPFISVSFIFVRLRNLVGLIPYHFIETSHLIVTFRIRRKYFGGYNSVRLEYYIVILNVMGSNPIIRLSIKSFEYIKWILQH